MKKFPSKIPGPVFVDKNTCNFRIWAPFASSIDLHIVYPKEKIIPMKEIEENWFEITLDQLKPGAQYFLRKNSGQNRPDPASRFQPKGVHGPSEVIAPSFPWSDHKWKGKKLKEYIIYEMHIGTFTSKGDLEQASKKLEYLADLGVTAVEIMPVSQFPGKRNWGYDGVHPFSVQNTYGGPDAFRKFVDKCHSLGIAVILDIVFNHLGPEGNYLAEFGPYFTKKYSTPWGAAVNFDDEYSDEVRNFFISCALYWLDDMHVDALRLDAIHGIFDFSAVPFLADLSKAVDSLAEKRNRNIYLIAESDLNDPRVLEKIENHGMGIHAQWSDDFHHALRAILTRDKRAYLQDFGETSHLVKAIKDGFVVDGTFSNFRKRRHGAKLKNIQPHKLVVFVQNHDQVANLGCGKRLTSFISFEGLKLAAATVILSPFLPLLFMGEEYGETSPFYFFTSYNDPSIAAAVEQGRKEEMKHLCGEGDIINPQAKETFNMSKIKGEPQNKQQKILLSLYKELIHLRKTYPSLSSPVSEYETGLIEDNVIFIKRNENKIPSILLLNFSDTQKEILWPWDGKWNKILDTTSEKFSLTKKPPTKNIHSISKKISLEIPPISASVWTGGED